ncbi:hypothetical protein VSDG_03193 [Cytospora chrysosperma]|uniref:Uncharacterized protein n=1 Tax=Cytospora chrysosperma TaxID=252740 RepID=A0A423WBK1_CYTCH|nr:hypothetical protein VSDG_03193 [Valsa sordida]
MAAEGGLTRGHRRRRTALATRQPGWVAASKRGDGRKGKTGRVTAGGPGQLKRKRERDGRTIPYIKCL